MAAALLLVPELVGGGDWERARRRESAFPRPAGGAGASHGSATLARGGAGRGLRGASPPATRGRARATRSPPYPIPESPGFARLLASLPGSRHASGLRADRRAHAPAPWRTRTPASWGCSLCLVQGSPPSVPVGGFEAER